MQTGENHMLKDIKLANIQANLAKLNYFYHRIVLRLVKVHRLHNLNSYKTSPYPPNLTSILPNVRLPPQ